MRPPGTRGSPGRTPLAPVAYSTACSSAARPMPSVEAASCTRATSNTCISPLKPCPSAPRRRSSGTKHSSKWSSPAGKHRLPSFGSRAPCDEALVAALDDEGGDPARAASRLDGREDDTDVRDRRVADELLVAVEHVAAVHAARGRLDRGRVRTVLRLGDRDRTGGRLGAAERREPPLLLLGGFRARAPGRRRSRPARSPRRSASRPTQSSSITAQRSRRLVTPPPP